MKTYSYDDLNIQGKMLVQSYVVNDVSLLNSIPEKEREKQIKQILSSGLVEYIIENNLIEFTKQTNENMEIVYRARLFLTPSDTIQKLRLIKK